MNEAKLRKLAAMRSEEQINIPLKHRVDDVAELHGKPSLSNLYRPYMLLPVDPERGVISMIKMYIEKFSKR